jgi:UDP-N-acetylmuramoyl-L-alanyl-D-glutamate--2,6-diaminopimelate ligase
MRIQLRNLIEAIPNIRLIGRDDILITGIEYDSRRVKPGMLFAAISGYKTDGYAFIPDAVKNGATAILSDRPVTADVTSLISAKPRQTLADLAAAFYGYPGKRLKITGITGTNGKSSSVFLTRKILETAGRKAGMLNSLVYDTGVKSYHADRTTPESLDVQRYLSEMKEAGCTDAVVEVSSHALVLARVENIDFKVGLYTTFSRDHLDFHNTMEEYLTAKKLFLKKLIGPEKTVVINNDVPEFAAFAGEAECPVITFSARGTRADIVVQSAQLSSDRTIFELATPSGTRTITTRLLGRYNVTNVTGAIATGFALKIPFDTIIQAIETAEPVPGRFRPVSLGQPFAVIVDYAHTPDGIERLSQSARELTTGRLMILFGCGGDRDRGKRPLMGQVASQNCDFVFITSDNPRTEEPQKIIDDIMPGISGKNYKVILDRKEAIRAIIKEAKPNDTILIAGKGAEDYQEIGTKKYPFEDTEEVIRALEETGYRKA